MAKGDIIFYSRTGPVDMLIRWWTRSRFSHTAVDIGDGRMVESGIHGIREIPLDLKDATVWSYSEHATDQDPKDLEKAVELMKRLASLGIPYGYNDFFINALPFARFFHTVMPNHYDCSALCTEFLIEAGGVDLCGLETDLHLVTPASLSKCLGVK